MYSVKPMLYMKRPILVEAFQVTEDNLAEVARWCGGEVVEEGARSERMIELTTCYGVATARQGYFVIKDMAKTFQTCSGEFFNTCYEPAVKTPLYNT